MKFSKFVYGLNIAAIAGSFLFLINPASALIGAKEGGKIDKDGGVTPGEFSLKQNYPNPFNPTTAFYYNLPKPGTIELTILDALGRNILTIYEGYQRLGSHNVLWNGKDHNGNQVPSGIYFYRLLFGDQSITKKMVLNR